MLIQQIVTARWQDKAAVSALADLVGTALEIIPAAETISTGALLMLLMPHGTTDEWDKLTKLLYTVRRSPENAHLWCNDPKGRKHYGSLMKRWVGQQNKAIANPDTYVDTPEELARRRAFLKAQEENNV